MNDWNNETRFNPDIKQGLTDEQVAHMVATGRINKGKDPTNKSYIQIIVGNLFTPFNILMFAIAALLIIVVGSKVLTNLMYLLIILCNVLIGTIQEIKSKKAIKKLKLLSDSKNRVIRNGQEIMLFPREMVLDDIVVLYPGDQVPADCIIQDDGLVEVNESLLTGESFPVKKTNGAKLYAGSFIVSGVVTVRCDKVGVDTYLHSIESKAKLTKQPKSKLMSAIYNIINGLAFIAIPLAIVVFFNELVHNSVLNPNQNLFPTYWGEESLITNAVFYSGVTITYMIPAGMALLASVSMATGIVQLAQCKTLVQNLYSVESLSRVDTLCLDKTGTLTDGTMELEECIILDESEDIQKIMSSFLASFKSSNMTAQALQNIYGHEGPYKAERVIEFSSARKYSAVKFKDRGWYVLGAPDFLIKDEELLAKAKNASKRGLRVILLTKVKEDFVDDDVLPGTPQGVVFFTLRDHVRNEVHDTMTWFRENDVDIKVISGDSLGTVCYIAKLSGIENWDKGIDMSKLPEDANIEELALNYSVFARVSPDQKAEIIAALKKFGRTTGVTGDGLNDLLAFKQADCSIALANGAPATKNVANIVLLDSNFANMKEAVFQGRRVVNNIQRSASLFVMKDILWFFITIMPILFGMHHVIQPTVMTIVNLLITGLASLFISLEPDKTRVKGDFFRNVTERAVLSGFYLFIPVLLIMLYFIFTSLARTNTVDVELLKTVFEDGEIVELGWIPVMALCITVSGFIVFFRNCRPFTRFRRILFIVTLVLTLILLYLAPEYFLVSGTDMLAETGGLLKIPEYIITHFKSNVVLTIYRTLTLEQILVFVVWCVISYPVYLFVVNFISKVVDKLLFRSYPSNDNK